MDALVAQFSTKKTSTKKAELSSSSSSVEPLILTTNPIKILEHPQFDVQIHDERNSEVIVKKPKKGESSTEAKVAPTFKTLDNFPLLCVEWTHFLRGRYLAAVSSAGRILIWDLETNDDEPLVIFSAEWNAPPLCVSWLGEHESKILGGFGFG